jgi:hypothetical protein
VSGFKLLIVKAISYFFQKYQNVALLKIAQLVNRIADGWVSIFRIFNRNILHQMPKEKPVSYKTRIQRLDTLNSMHYVEVPAHIIDELGGKLKMRLLCTINNTLTFPCGPTALGNGSGYISLNKKRMEELGVRYRDELTVSLVKDPSKYGMEMPEELNELFRQDKEGEKRFKLLPPGKQRYIIYYVNMVKSSQLKVERAIRLIENLKKTTIGKESFREILAKNR